MPELKEMNAHRDKAASLISIPWIITQLAVKVQPGFIVHFWYDHTKYHVEPFKEKGDYE